MGNELDKIEQNGTQIAKHPKIPEAAGQLLKEEVKVCLFASWGLVIELHGLLTQECSTYMHSVTRLDTGVMCGYAIEYKGKCISHYVQFASLCILNTMLVYSLGK